MARIASQALGGYYALPADHVVPIAALLDTSHIEKLTVVDPCAADGTAVLGLIHQWGLQPRQHGRKDKPTLFSCELEAERAAALKRAVNPRLGWDAEQQALDGDAFCVQWSSGHAHILFLNPPYDTDKVAGRLEHRFLLRFTPLLAPGGGALLFVVPHYVLNASAAYLATEYEHIRCFRFLPDAFEGYRQVVLVASRRMTPLPVPDPILEATITRWALDATSIPELTARPAPTVLPGHTTTLYGWKLAPIDLAALKAAFQPGRLPNGDGIKRYGLDQDMRGLLGGRPFPVAMPMRAGHIAQALSAGIMNGVVLEADDPSLGLPAILAKGVFDREYVTVEHRKDKKGKVTGIVRVQQPKLRLCALDVARGTYTDLRPGTVPTDARTLDTFTVADLITRYQGSMREVMRRMCPPLHRSGDPAAALPLAPMDRTPYRAQAETISALLKLVGQGDHPFVIGEVGTGKSTIALATIAALHPKHYTVVKAAMAVQGHTTTGLRPVRRALILCPPHLLQSWCDQVRAVLPGASVTILQSIPDLYQTPPSPAPGQPGEGTHIAILSRETAKLGYSLVGGRTAQQTCPRCGGRILQDGAFLVREHARCPHTTLQPDNPMARITQQLAVLLVPADPSNFRVSHYTPQRTLRLWGERQARMFGSLDQAERQSAQAAVWEDRWRGNHTPEASPLGRVIVRLIDLLWDTSHASSYHEQIILAIGMLFHAMGSAGYDWLLQTVEALYQESSRDTTTYGTGAVVRRALRELLVLIPAEHPERAAVIDRLKALPLDCSSYSHGNGIWKNVDTTLAYRDNPATARSGSYERFEITMTETGACVWRTKPAGVEAAAYALEVLAGWSRWSRSPVCGEYLYAAAPKPRRYPLATYIARHARDSFDLLVLDEGHEFAGDGSAQELAAHRLSECGKPTLLLTGSLMNGYASGLFRNLWALSRRFRQEFDRDEVTRFVTRYGYRKVLEEVEQDDASAKTVGYGSVTDRRERDQRAMRALGEAPGVLPLLLLEHVLPYAVTIQKADLDDALPPMMTEIVTIPLARTDPVAQQLKDNGLTLLSDTAHQIGKDSFTPLTGKLFGALGQIPSYYDRATWDTGNGLTAQANRRWEVRYPESVGGDLVISAPLLPPATILPKERWLLRTLGDELAEGRNVLIYVTHTGSGMSERLHRLIGERLGEYAAILLASAAPTQKREAWINEQVIGQSRRILIANPITVQTGLNNLVYFSTVIWMENPNCNAIVYRQANGRVHRIGQIRTVRIYVPIYADTPQTLAQELLARKTMASEQVDGMDVRGSLEAAGAGEQEAIDTLELGRAIYALLEARRA